MTKEITSFRLSRCNSKNDTLIKEKYIDDKRQSKGGMQNE